MNRKYFALAITLGMLIVVLTAIGYIPDFWAP